MNQTKKKPKRVRSGYRYSGECGYIVGAPSNHISGKQYRWRDGLYQPERLPDSLLGAIHYVVNQGVINAE